MKSASLSQKAYSLLMFLAVSVLSGLLLAGLAVPFAALAGGTAKAAADSLEHIPQELRTPPQAERSRVLMANGEVLATFYDENRIYVPLSEIAPVMQDAQIAIEDHRFYEHGAIDFQGFGRAFVKTLLGDTQGASTLTQQYVKLARQDMAIAAGDAEAARAATEVTIERKIIEARYAMALEEELTKDQILERYLNIAYYGDGAYGVEAAAQHYFGVSAKDLDLPQAAMLAGLVQNPVTTNPVKNENRGINRRNTVINRMADLGIISKEAAEEAKQTPFNQDGVVPMPNGCVASDYPFLCEYVRLSVLKLPSMGETQEERRNLLNRGGITITTLIDPEAQASAEAAVAALVKPTDPVLGATVLLQPQTGLIVAMAQSRPVMGTGPGETWYNYNVGEDMGGAEGYQAGSTFKTFALAAALDLGMTPDKKYNAPGEIDLSDEEFRSCTTTFKPWGGWELGNQGGNSFGTIDMREATQKSVNTYFGQLVRDVGICPTVQMAANAGVEMATGEDLVEKYNNIPSFVIGTAEVTPLSLAEAYATFANRGIRCDPIILEGVRTKDGVDLEVPTGNCQQVIRPEVADGVNYLLQGVAEEGTGRPAALKDGRPQAGKTGTIDNYEALWYAGYTPEMVGISMLAADKTHEFWADTTPGQRSLRRLQLPGGYRIEGSGGGDAGLMWRGAMSVAVADLPKTEFVQPTDEILEGVEVPVPDVSGLGYNAAKEVLEAAGFTTQRVGVHHRTRRGTFLGITPSDTAIKFSTIRMRVSLGPAPAPPPPKQTQAPSAPPADTPADPPADTPADPPAAPPADPPAEDSDD